LLGEERREYILNQVKKTGSISAIDIAKTLDVSETTIRRDLNRLAKKNLLRRTYGGAMAIIPVGAEMKFNAQKEKFIKEKKKIALAASKLIEDGDVILLEAGTTGFQTALNIANIKNLTDRQDASKFQYNTKRRSAQHRDTFPGRTDSGPYF